MLAVLLLDENTSPRIIPALWKHRVDAVHVRDRNLLRAADHELWKFAMEEARTIVTINARDFRKLAQSTPAHPGIIVIPSGASSETQLKLILAAVGWVTSTNSAIGFSNRYVEVNAQGEIVRAELLHEGSSPELRAAKISNRRAALMLPPGFTSFTQATLAFPISR